MAATPPSFPFRRTVTSTPPHNCYETTAQPVCHRELVLAVVYEDHIEFWCATHAPAAFGVQSPEPEPEPQPSPVTFPEP